MQTAGSLVLGNYFSQLDLDPGSFFPGYYLTEWVAFSSPFCLRNFRKEKRLEKMFTELFLSLASGSQLSVIYVRLFYPFRIPEK